jgi:hypothetical protein
MTSSLSSPTIKSRILNRDGSIKADSWSDRHDHNSNDDLVRITDRFQRNDRTILSSREATSVGHEVFYILDPRSSRVYLSPVSGIWMPETSTNWGCLRVMKRMHIPHYDWYSSSFIHLHILFCFQGNATAILSFVRPFSEHASSQHWWVVIPYLAFTHQFSSKPDRGSIPVSSRLTMHQIGWTFHLGIFPK